jgi:hypothetical protein
LNIGSGLSCGEHWENVDCSLSLRFSKLPLIGKLLARLFKFPNWPKGTVYGDILSDSLVPAGSCSLVFVSHVLEHLSFSDSRYALRNIYKFLRPRGVLRIIVPDLEVCIRNYIQRRDMNDEKAVELLMRELGMGMTGSRRTLLSRLRDAFGNSRHQWMYDKHSLEALLMEAGFKELRLSDYGVWSHEIFSEVEERGRSVNSITYEAYKN